MKSQMPDLQYNAILEKMEKKFGKPPRSKSMASNTSDKSGILEKEDPEQVFLKVTGRLPEEPLSGIRREFLATQDSQKSQISQISHKTGHFKTELGRPSSGIQAPSNIVSSFPAYSEPSEPKKKAAKTELESGLCFRGLSELITSLFSKLRTDLILSIEGIVKEQIRASQIGLVEKMGEYSYKREKGIEQVWKELKNFGSMLKGLEKIQLARRECFQDYGKENIPPEYPQKMSAKARHSKNQSMKDFNLVSAPLTIEEPSAPVYRNEPYLNRGGMRLLSGDRLQRRNIDCMEPRDHPYESSEYACSGLNYHQKGSQKCYPPQPLSTKHSRPINNSYY